MPTEIEALAKQAIQKYISTFLLLAAARKSVPAVEEFCKWLASAWLAPASNEDTGRRRRGRPVEQADRNELIYCHHMTARDLGRGYSQTAQEFAKSVDCERISPKLVERVCRRRFDLHCRMVRGLLLMFPGLQEFLRADLKRSPRRLRWQAIMPHDLRQKVRIRVAPRSSAE